MNWSTSEYIKEGHVRQLPVLYKKGVQERRMKKTRWLKKGIYGLAWSFILLTGIKIVVGGLSNVESVWWEQLTRSVTGAVFQITAPASAYVCDEENPETLAELLMRYVRGTMPVVEYAGRSGEAKDRLQDPFYVEQIPAAESGNEGEKLSEESVTENTAETSITDGETEGQASDDIGQGETETVLAEAGDSTEENADMEVLSSDIFTPKVIGTEYPLAKLCDYDFLIRNFYAVSEITTITSEELNASELLAVDLSIEKTEEPQILIYHTHSQEEFADSRAGVAEDTVIGVGEYLAAILREQYGYNVYHDTTAYDVVDGAVDRNEAYNYAAEGVSAILEQYPSIEVVIDLHRDGVNDDVHLVTEVNGKPTAQVMFVNGISKTSWQGQISYLENPYIKDNLAFSLMLQLKAEAYYPEYTRRIMIKAYRYNMHFRGRSLLVEVGAQTNTLQEAKNAMEPLAVILHETLSGGAYE